ncbi:MAG: GNAT family N-acetyltransferase [Janthinobacterium lividum]
MRVESGAERLRSARPGQRWVLRVRQDDGSATDVVGWLVGVEDDVAALEGPLDASSPGGEAPSWRVPLAAVVVARRAPAARGGPDPSRTPADVLDRLGVEAWAVELEPLGDWTLRAADGFTGRANSCLAVGDPGSPVAEAAAAVEAYAAQQGIAPLAQVVTGSAEDAALRAVGWTETYVATDVLATRLADLLGDDPADPRVEVGDELTAAWRAAFDEYRSSDVDPTLVTRLLDGRRPRAFASVEVDGEVVALGRGHLSDGWLGVATVWTRPDHRRQGLGTAVVRALAGWAAHRGARWCYLQVETANEPAHAAYERLGFVLHHRYHYLAPGPRP